LIVRVAQVFFGANLAAACSLVLIFADMVALAALVVMPKPVIAVMGGISHTESETAILNVTLLAGVACVVSFPVLLISSTATVGPRRNRWQFALEPSAPRLRPDRGLWALAVASVAIWAFVLPVTQPQQQLANRVDRDLKAGRIIEAVRLMAQYERSDFPARWDPPPHVGYGERTPPIIDVMEVILAEQPPAWIATLFTAKFGSIAFNPDLTWPGGVDDKEFRRYVDVLLSVPAGPAIAAKQRHWLEHAHQMSGHSEARRADIQALIDLADTYDPDKHPEDNFARSF
jgi:hypothetical protein